MQIMPKRKYFMPESSQISHKVQSVKSDFGDGNSTLPFCLTESHDIWDNNQCCSRLDLSITYSNLGKQSCSRQSVVSNCFNRNWKNHQEYSFPFWEYLDILSFT
jgi:hypothetical protein